MSELLLGALLVLTIAWLVVRIRRNKAAEKAERMPKADSRQHRRVSFCRHQVCGKCL